MGAILRIVGVSNKKSEFIHIDEYIPIQITLGEWNNSFDPTVYWRSGDFSESLVEIGVSLRTGEIRSFTLTQAKDISFKNIEVSHRNSTNIQGIPICDVSIWSKDGYEDEKLSFSVNLSDHEFRVTFGITNQYLFQETSNGCIGFGLNDENQLYYITVKGLSSSEWIRLKDALSYMAK